jgi:molecular chaperone GrpE
VDAGLEPRPEPPADPGSQRPPEDDPGTDALRARLLQRFDAWLSRVLAEEEPPAGLPAELLRELEEAPGPPPQPDSEERNDWFALWAAMTALTQEVKLQGRAFSRLHDSLAPLVQMRSLLGDNLAAHQEALRLARDIAEQALAARSEREDELARQAERRASRGLLDVLIDTRDRLARGLDLARAHAAELRTTRGWRAFFGLGRATTKRLLEVTLALEQGYHLTLQRIEAALDRLGVQAIDCIGAPFDPNFMTAADVEENPDVPDGTVLEIYRNGYAWNGETLRPAQVKVARRPSPAMGTRRSALEGLDDEPA